MSGTSAHTLMVMAGGTGGHVFPGLAVADLMRSRGWNVIWMGNPAGMEAKLVAGRGYGAENFAPVRFGALRGKGLLRKLMLPFSLLSGFWQAACEIRRVQPDVVLGMGGYISFPGGVMARLLGKPLVLHEQNSVVGLANRMLAKIATRVLSGFPEILPGAIWAGNPVRTEIAALPTPAERYAAHDGPIRVLVLGGSLGAAVLNETVPKGLALIPDDEQPQVVHQSGEKHLAALQSNYSAANVAAHCVAFIDDMAGAYDWADLVVCRAGALTVAELAAAGVASVLVPFPHAVDDHQTSNARFLSQAGGAILLPQAELTPEKIALIRNYSREQLQQMAERARELAKPDATEIVAMACMELVK
jgi:UDP-N-acetylglucosamine--N-acetylmuramyl-(pentapeptide) pyrophosphoryl-undecaprenol N-acetylglucosamine transferase